jgi:hypothetical protein
MRSRMHAVRRTHAERRRRHARRRVLAAAACCMVGGGPARTMSIACFTDDTGMTVRSLTYLRR